MPIIISDRSLRSSIVTEIVSSENDGSISNANWTGLPAGLAGTVQAMGYIGDSATASTIPDRDAYRVELADGWTLRVAVDAKVGGGDLIPYVRVYDSSGALVAHDDGSGSGADVYLSYTNTTGSFESYTVFVADAIFYYFNGGADSPFDADSTNGSINGTTVLQDRGSYRILLNTSIDASHGQILNGNDNVADTLNGGPGNDVLDGLSGNDTLNGAGGNDLFRWNRLSGNDTIDGGAGLNALDAIGDQFGQQYSITSTGAGFVLTVNDASGANTATVTQLVQRLDIHGRDGNDTLTIAGSAGTNLNGGVITFWGDEGSDRVIASGASVRIDAHGGNGNDTLMTGSGNDNIYGGSSPTYLMGVPASTLPIMPTSAVIFPSTLISPRLKTLSGPESIHF